MSRRISQRRRQNFSQVLEAPDIVTEAQDVLCEQDIRHTNQPRKLIYRRLRGIENTFDGSWPQSTNIYCWYCRLPFVTIPIPIVQQYDSTKELYDVYGVTCSPACSKSYIMQMRNNDTRTRLMWQCKMLIEVFGWPADKPIPTAHPWQALDVFGGYMPVEVWRKHQPGMRIELKMPPFVPFHIFQETELKGLCYVDQTVGLTTATASDTLEEQALQHGAAFSLKGLKRPDVIIKTHEELQAAHPQHSRDQSDSAFAEFLNTQPVPTDEECLMIQEQREIDRKAKRKRKPTVLTAKQLAAAARGKTLFLSTQEKMDLETPQTPEVVEEQKQKKTAPPPAKRRERVVKKNKVGRPPKKFKFDLPFTNNLTLEELTRQQNNEDQARMQEFQKQQQILIAEQKKMAELDKKLTRLKQQKNKK